MTFTLTIHYFVSRVLVDTLFSSAESVPLRRHPFVVEYVLVCTLSVQRVLLGSPRLRDKQQGSASVWLFSLCVRLEVCASTKGTHLFSHSFFHR